MQAYFSIASIAAQNLPIARSDIVEPDRKKGLTADLSQKKGLQEFRLIPDFLK
jgi:hypothetical protein